MAAAQAQLPPTRYTVAQVSRILGVPSKRLRAWQSLGLLRSAQPANEILSIADNTGVAGNTLGIADLARVRRLASLSKARLSNLSISRSVEAMQRRYGVPDPLAGRMALPQGARLLFRHNGSLLDPLTQQFGFDFDPPATAAQPASIRSGEPAPAATSTEQAQQLFTTAVRLEERAGTAAEAAGLYREVLRLWPTHAPASINLGTILYNAGDYIEAERCYRAAVEIDPDYALAFFNLGNVLDELQRLPEAVAAYTRAIQIVPQYADVHYNLALAYERLGQRRPALRHWMHYVRLDPVGPWAAHARAQAKKALATEKLSIVSRFGQRAS